MTVEVGEPMWVSRWAPLAGALALFALMVVTLDSWTTNDAFFHYLQAGIDIGSEDPDILRFKAAGEENCIRHAKPQEVVSCLDYQQFLSTDVRWNYPIHTLLAYWLVAGSEGRVLLDRVVWIGVAASLTGFILACVLFGTALRPIDDAARPVAAIVVPAPADASCSSNRPSRRSADCCSSSSITSRS